MLESLFKSPAAVQRLRSGILGSCVDPFVTRLAELGYTPWACHAQVVLVADLGRWMAHRRLRVEDLNEAHVSKYVAQRGRQADRRRLACLHFLDYLRWQEVIPPHCELPDTSPVTLCCRSFAEHLSTQRGLCLGSVNLYVAAVRDFLGWCFDTGTIQVGTLESTHITQYLLARSQIRAPRSMGTLCTALRHFLRYLFAQGLISADLSPAVLAVPAARMSHLPRHLSAADVDKLLATCNRATATGRRDYAILLLLARLGLRAGEVAQLELEDIRWRAAEIVVRGKGNIIDRLPLLPDVGEALALYIRQHRPATESRRVFLRCWPPIGALRGREAISSVVRTAVGRAGLDPPSRGAHLLRHSLGTRLIREGASMAEISQVLRHHAPGSTEIYAKVDFEALRSLSQPWPGAGDPP